MTNYPDLIPQKFMGLEDGTNAPLLHQRTIARLTAKLYPHYEAGTSRDEPIPEMMVGEYNRFNYKTRQWLRYRQGDGGIAAE